MLVFAGIALPAICLAVAAGFSEFEGEWQSGNLYDYLGYLLMYPAGAVFYPFLAYSMICLAFFLIDERRADQFYVRLGIYFGVLLGGHYAVVLYVTITEIPQWFDARLVAIPMFGAILAVAGFFAWLILGFLSRLLPHVFAALAKIDFRSARVWSVLAMWLMFSVATIIFCTLTVPELGNVLGSMLLGPVLIVVFISFAAAPFWAMCVYGFVSIRIVALRKGLFRFTLAQLMASVSLIAAYLAAWRWGVRLALEEYARLPANPPSNCYVCTAAAQGHPWLVDSRRVHGHEGGKFLVNAQMRNLKAAEIVLASTLPRGHRFLRRLYDRVGPPLAARIQHPLLADAAFLLLKPAEWCGRAALAVFVPSFAEIATRLYNWADPCEESPCHDPCSPC